MDYISIMAIDGHSSKTEGITLSAKTPALLREGLKEFESKLTYSRYELVSDDFIENFDANILNVLDEFEVSI